MSLFLAVLAIVGGVCFVAVLCVVDDQLNDRRKKKHELRMHREKQKDKEIEMMLDKPVEHTAEPPDDPPKITTRCEVCKTSLLEKEAWTLPVNAIGGTDYITVCENDTCHRAALDLEEANG